MPSISRDMLEISRCATQFRAERLAPLGLKSCHASYLVEVCKEPGISQDQLAQRICINKSNVARQVAFLEEAGYLNRCTCKEDKRVTELTPTQKALDALPEIRQILADWRNMLTEELTEEEQEALVTILDKLRNKASEWMENH